MSNKPTPSKEDVEAIVIDILGNMATGHIERNSKLEEDLGLDSLDTIEVVQEIEERLSTSIDERLLEFKPEMTVGELADRIHEILKPASA